MESFAKEAESLKPILIAAKIPRELHAELTREAEAYGISLADSVRLHLKQKITFARFGQ